MPSDRVKNLVDRFIFKVTTLSPEDQKDCTDYLGDRLTEAAKSKKKTTTKKE